MASLTILITALVIFSPLSSSLPTTHEGSDQVSSTSPINISETTTLISNYSLTQTPNSTCLLSSEQVRDIQSHQSDLLYMVVNGQVFVKNSPIDLYVELFRIVANTAGTSQQVLDVWLSRTPCKECISILEQIFSGRNPRLHIETWRTSDVKLSYKTVLQGMGCIVTLKRAEYLLEAWNWKKFAEDTKTSSCDYYNTDLSSSYHEESDYLDRALKYTSGLEELCL